MSKFNGSPINGIVIAGLLLCSSAGVMQSASAECHDKVVYRERHPSHHHHVLGTAVGAVVGGVVGSQFGGGSGKTLATVGGAVAGGAIGHKVAKDNSRKTYRTVERVCTPDNPPPSAG